MRRAVLFLFCLSGTTLFLDGVGYADIPAPPVDQSVGMRDVGFANVDTAACRVCHGTSVSNKHHLLYGKTLPVDVPVPYPDSDGDGKRDTLYSCISCHGSNFSVQPNCVVCHTNSPHHSEGNAVAGKCKSCHGSVVDDMGDGHYIPAYSPSLVTPTPRAGDGNPANSRGAKAGACNYCHDKDALATPVILTTKDLHHGKGFTKCEWCHTSATDTDTSTATAMRSCEKCHGPVSLHNIQADSLAGGNVGTIVVGGEDAGYGHVGKDAGPGNSDCWGCHGFAMASAPGTGPIVPTVFRSDRTTVTAGASSTVVLTGSAFTNTLGDQKYDVDILLTGANGAMTLQPDVIVDEGMLSVTIPANMPPGRYDLKAAKADFLSNPVVISILPQVKIDSAKYNRSVVKNRDGGTVTLTGSGFAGYAKGSGTAITAVVRGKNVTASTVSWTDTKIVAKFNAKPSKVTVKSVFGKATKAM